MRQVAGVFRQGVILCWKNFILFRRNVSGTVCEILLAIIFLVMLVIIRFFVDVTDNAEEDNVPRSVLSSLSPSSELDMIMYYPNSLFVQQIITNAVQFIKADNPRNNYTVQIVGTDISTGRLLDSANISHLIALISFPESFMYASALPKQIEYSIHTQERSRFQYNVNSQFYSIKEFLYTGSAESYCANNKYTLLYTTVFAPIKYAIDLALIERATLTSFQNNTKQIMIAKFNCPAWKSDSFKTGFSFFSYILIMIAYMFTMLVNLGNIIMEKQTKMKEYLRLAGIKWYIVWITWLIRSMILYLMLCVLFTIVLEVPFSARLYGGPKAIFAFTNWTVAFSMCFVYAMQVSMFTLLLGQIFSTPFIGKIIAIIIWLVTVIDFYGNMSAGGKYFFCFLPNAGLLFCFQAIYQFERSSKSLTFANMYTNLYDDPTTLGGILLAMMFWTLVYVPITWYIERVNPGEYGAPLPFYFPCMPSYWCEQKDPDEGMLEMNKITEEYGFEKDPNDLNVFIHIKNMTKRFRVWFKEKTVVNNISIKFYENQITGLLGHNGAGKTTTTFMLSGIYAPSAGTAYVLGHNIRTEMNKIRSSMGFCPQHDILYDDMTVEEHLDLIASIKGFSNKEIGEEIVKISTYVGLQNDLKKKSKQLSGGMKRRLSVAMALIGDSKIIILDEPTSGLDPFNRRVLWEIIRKFKKGRAILLTTHFMEEADALSDRIAIMNHGEVKCCGSPLFLKNTFGSGYRLTLSKGGRFDETNFRALLTQEATKYTVETNIAAEMCVSIPFEQSNKLPTLLTSIESRKSDIDIDGYGISSPTIEEVFIKVGSIDIDNNAGEKKLDAKEVEDTNAMIDNDNLLNAFGKEFSRNSGCLLFMQQLQHLWLKRLHIFRRRWILALFILLLPLGIEIAMASIIPSETNRINQIRGIVNTLGSNNLSVTNYSYPNTMFYTVTNNTAVSSNIQSRFNLLFAGRSNGIQPTRLDNSIDINEHVTALRKNDLRNIINNYYLGMHLEATVSSIITPTIYWSSLAMHSAASLLNEASTLLLRSVANDDTRYIKTINVPIAANSSLSNASVVLEVLACIDSMPLSILNSINAIIIAFIVSIMVMHVARERCNGSKQLQLLSGLHYATYWLSHYLFDVITCLVNIISIIVAIKLVAAAKNDTTNEVYVMGSNDALPYLLILLLFSCFTWMCYAYLWSYFFKSDIICFIVLIIIMGVVAFIDMVLAFLVVIVQGGATTVSMATRLINLVRYILIFLFPNVLIKRAEYDQNTPALSVKEPGIGWLIIICVVQFLVGNIIILLVERRTFRNCSCAKICGDSGSGSVAESPTPIDQVEEDVQSEITRIASCDLKEQSNREPLLVKELFKKFKKGKLVFAAVNELSFGISTKECFGLLGLNGAGKTTTFKILTGELEADSGVAFINGYDIERDMFKARGNLGFCPQFDYLPEFLNVQETFTLFANLRGMARKESASVLRDLIKVFKLDEFNKKLVQTLSGGNKRKVSAAIAFIGRPSVIILDEPTTGMDPAARRYLWTVIKKARDLGMTIVLTTHSMEEAEALSTKLGIMVNGQFKCFGSVQHLKNKYGRGYTLVLKLKSQESSTLVNAIEKAEHFVNSQIPYAKIKDKQQETLFYQIEYDAQIDGDSVERPPLQTIAELFTLIELNKDAIQIETYSLSQTTLEQVFLSFARQQIDRDLVAATPEDVATAGEVNTIVNSPANGTTDTTVLTRPPTAKLEAGA